MNRKMVFYTVGKMVCWEAAMLVLPVIVSLIYGDGSWVALSITIAIALVLGGSLTLSCRTKNQVIYAKEGFVITALAWLAFSAVGAFPFVLSGEIPRYVDAFFETVSGFTTTGATILERVEVMSHGLLFWRSFTHWVGGMGILVFVMALIPEMSDRSIHLMRAEMPGPVVGKLVPRARDTASLLYKIYIAMTAAEVILLLLGGMSFFESVVHAFGTAGTGGFGVRSDSFASYSSYIQWVVTVFMFLFGINFNVYYLLLIRRFRNAVQSTEMWIYLGAVVTAAVTITANILPMAANFSEAVRLSAFQVTSFITTTGYATTDFNAWPGFSKGILLLLMFVGACAGSTGGGFKVSRVVMLCKLIGREVRQLLHPRSVSTVRFEGKTVEDATLHSVAVYLAVYILCFIVVVLVLCLEPFDFMTEFSAAASCFNNIGPILSTGSAMSNFAAFSDGSKLLLSFAMLFGRLEIFPMLIALIPSTWTKK